MINKLYKSKHGTPHIVRVVGKHREMLRGETLECTAHTYQVLAQRQQYIPTGMLQLLTLEKIYKYEDNEDFDPFTMEYELFMEEYEDLK